MAVEAIGIGGLERGDRLSAGGDELRVHRVYDEYGPLSPYSRIVECYTKEGAKRLVIVYPDEVRLTRSFYDMNRGDYSVVGAAEDSLEGL